jgi:hypothetical protein
VSVGNGTQEEMGVYRRASKTLAGGISTPSCAGSFIFLKEWKSEGIASTLSNRRDESFVTKKGGLLVCYTRSACAWHKTLGSSFIRNTRILPDGPINKTCASSLTYLIIHITGYSMRINLHVYISYVTSLILTRCLFKLMPIKIVNT